MGIKFTNNAEGALAAGISDSATTLTLKAGQGNLFPEVASGSGDYFYATLVDISGNREIIKVTERQAGSNVFGTIVRAADGSTAQAWLVDDIVELRIPSIVFEEFEASIAAAVAASGSNSTDIATLQSDVTDIEDGVHASGNKLWFYQNVAPTGWTIDATVEDTLIGVKDQSSGGLGYDVNGGNEGGSWTPTTHRHTGGLHTHTGGSHTHGIGSHTHAAGTHVHATSGHTLLESEIPSHTHPVPSGAGNFAVTTHNYGGSEAYGDFGKGGITPNTGSRGGGGSHDHGNTAAASGNTGVSNDSDTDAGGTGNTGQSGAEYTTYSSQPSTDRPLAAVGIICTKD
jgi:hemolysin-activating ACP:hemolysin acyltransferase